MKLPSTATLSAFESAARHSNFSRAAEELHTSQSAISRHIADLEARLQTRLFTRERKTVRLTEQGEFFYAAVTSGLRAIRNATEAVASWGHRQQITIACTHEISHLFVMPRFERLQENVVDDATIRIMTYEYDALEQAIDPRIDIILTYDTGGSDNANAIPVMPETVRPVCSPKFCIDHNVELSGPPSDWQGMPLLRLTKPNRGWSSWDDWFEFAGSNSVAPQFIDFDNYVYLLEACASGKGLALGWRGLVDRHLASGSLVTAVEPEHHSSNALFAKLTVRGQHNETARKCARDLATC